MTDWRDATYHTTGSLFVLRPEIVFCAQVDALTFAWAETFQPAGTIRHIYPKNIVYGSMTGGDVIEGRTLLAGSAPGRDDLGRCRCMGTTSIEHESVTYTCVSVWVSNQGVNDGELNLSTDTYITIVDERRIWGKKPFVTDDGYVYKDGLGVAFTETIPPVANAGQAYMNVPGTSAPASVDFSGARSYVTEQGAAIQDYVWSFPGCSPSSALTSLVSGVSVPAGFRYASLLVRDDSDVSYDPIHTSWVPIVVRDGRAAQEGFVDAFEITRHRHEMSGQSIAFKVYDDLPNGSDYFDVLRGHALIVYYVGDDATPSTVTDYSGHRRDATGANSGSMTAQVPGACGRKAALRLSGGTDYVSVDVSGTMDVNAGALTIMVNPTDGDSWDHTADVTLVNIGASIGHADSAIRVYVDAQDLVSFAVRDKDGRTNTWQYVPSGFPSLSERWYGLTVTWSLTAGVCVYVDGVQVGAAWTDFAGFTAATLYAGEHWAGDIQHLALVEGTPDDATVLGVPDVRLNRVMDGALVIYAEREVYAGTAGSLSGAGQTNREHVKFAGWIHRMQMGHEATDLGQRTYTELECIDAGKRLELLNRQEFVHERGTPSTESEWAFIRVADLNADRAVVMVLHYDSNVLDVADFVWSGTGEQYAYPWWRITEDNIYEAVDVICQKIAHKLTCDKTGTLRMLRDPQLAAAANRTQTVTEVLHPADMNALDYAHSRAPRVYWDWAYAVQANTADASTSPAITVFRAVAPGPVPGQGVTAQEYDEQVVTDQDDLNRREGQRYHIANAQWSRFRVDVAYAGDRGWDAATGQIVRLAIPRTRAAQSGITFPYPEYHEKVLATNPATLVQYLRMNGTGSRTEYDASPAGNHGYHFIAPARAATPLGMGDGYGSAWFDGTYNGIYLEGNPSAKNSLSTDVSLSTLSAMVWFRMTTAIWASAYAGILYNVGVSNAQFVQMRKTAVNELGWLHVASATTTSVTMPLSDNAWHCAILTVDTGADEMRAYLDGALVDVRTGLGAWGAGTIDECWGMYNSLNGWGAHIATWASVLTAAQVADLAVVDNRFVLYGVDTRYVARSHSKRVSLELEREVTAPAAHTVVVEGETGTGATVALSGGVAALSLGVSGNFTSIVALDPDPSALVFGAEGQLPSAWQGLGDFDWFYDIDLTAGEISGWSIDSGAWTEGVGITRTDIVRYNMAPLLLTSNLGSVTGTVTWLGIHFAAWPSNHGGGGVGPYWLQTQSSNSSIWYSAQSGDAWVDGTPNLAYSSGVNNVARFVKYQFTDLGASGTVTYDRIAIGGTGDAPWAALGFENLA